MDIKSWLRVFALLSTISATVRTQDIQQRTRTPNTISNNEWIGKPAPEIHTGQWVNSMPLTLASLRGKVVLLEFWTYGCYNCRNTIPYIKTWYDRYKGSAFQIVAVHSPEFEGEKDFLSVVTRTKELGIRYPVVTDNEMEIWNDYHQEYWPVLYLIDKNGLIRYVHVGEGHYEETEQWIKVLVATKE